MVPRNSERLLRTKPFFHLSTFVQVHPVFVLICHRKGCKQPLCPLNYLLYDTEVVHRDADLAKTVRQRNQCRRHRAGYVRNVGLALAQFVILQSPSSTGYCTS